MYHYFGDVRTPQGPVLTGFYMRLVDTTTGDTATLYADISQTPIVTVSGIADAALVDGDGNANFFVDSGTYHIDYYAQDGTTLVKRIQNVPMEAVDGTLRDDLIAPSTGASLVGFDATQTYADGTVGATLNGLFGSFMSSPNYVGTGDDDTFTISQGSTGTPSTTQSATMVVEKTANVAAFNAFAGLAFKQSSATDARATAVYGESTDNVGGSSSFVEGGRFLGTLVSGANGSAYGAISVAGTNATGPTTPKYLIGHEATIDNQIGPDAPTFGSFNKDVCSAAYNATAGDGTGGTRYKPDAAFLTNPYSRTQFQTGILFGEGSINHTGMAFRANTLVNGIDMSLATISGYAFHSPGCTIDGNGSPTFTPPASSTPATNGQMTFELTNNTTLKIHVKGSDGTVRSSTLTLS